MINGPNNTKHLHTFKHFFKNHTHKKYGNMKSPKAAVVWPIPSLSPFYMNCTPKDHWPSASGKDSSVLEETLCGRACCWGWMGSASQCSMREEGGSRWPYLVPSLGGSRDGKKYLKWQGTKTQIDKDDNYMDTEKTVEYNGQTKKWEEVQMKKECFFFLLIM